ncbi:MAG: two-component regulator propeller domain-containing protein, partial [Bacteroidota bacterium]
ETISHNNVYDLSEDSRGYLWVATYNGLNYIDLTTVTEKPVFRDIGHDEGIPHTFVYSSTEVEPGLYWVATYRGLVRMHFDVTESDEARLEIFQMDKDDDDALVNSTCYQLVKDRFGQYWVGTFIGLSKIVERDGQTSFENYKSDSDDPHSLSNNSVSTMYVDRRGNLWVGTRGGLNLLEQKGPETPVRFRVFGRQEGISNEVIHTIEEDELGRLWLGTNDGLFRFDIEKAMAGEPGAVKRYGLQDGLVSSGVTGRSSFRDEEGNIYIGGSNGLNYFHPKEIQENKHVPPLVFTELKVLNEVIQPSPSAASILKKAIHLTDTIFLKHWQNILSLKFAALDFTNPRQNQYAHQLVGLNPDWVDTQNDNSVTFTNLPSGTHELLVKGSNNDGLWNETPKRMFIVVRPPPWKTTWAYLLYLLSFCGLVYTFTRWRIQRRIQKIEQTAQIEKARFQGREELRQQNAADFHDELGHRLSLIALYLELAERQSQPKANGTNYFEKIKTNTVALSSGIRDLIWSLDPQKDSLGQTLSRLQEFGDQLFAYADTHFKTAGTSEDLERIPLEPDVRKHLLLLFKEAMNNVLKYAQASEARLSVTIKPDAYLIQLRDDGLGFDPEVVDPGYGLKNMKERALKMNAQLGIESAKGAGTCISLTLRKDH